MSWWGEGGGLTPNVVWIGKVEKCSCAGVLVDLSSAWTDDALYGLAWLLQAHQSTKEEREGSIIIYEERMRRGVLERGPPRVKLRNSLVFSFITSARISCAARTPFYSLPKQRYKTVLSTKVLTKGSLEMKFGEQKIENGNFWSGALVTSKLLLWLFSNSTIC